LTRFRWTGSGSARKSSERQRILSLPVVRPDSLKHRHWIAAGFGAIALAELAVLGMLAAGLDGRTRVGPVLLIIHSPDKPLWLGLMASIGVIALGSRPLRRLGFLLMASLVFAAIIVIARTSPPIITKSDIAVTELYVQLAAKGDLLVGPYSRFQWHHPGPLYFWLQVPFYALSGDRAAGLYAGALAMNLMSLGVLAWVLLRVDRGALAVTVLGGCLLFIWRDRFVMASPWTAHVPVLSTVTFVVLAAAVASGRRWLLPLLILFGSFIAQAHVAMVPLFVLLSAGAVAAAAIGTPREDRPSLRGIVNGSAWLLAALWLLPVAEQLSHTPGNLVQLWRFFVGGTTHPVQSYSRAIAAMSYALVGTLRPDLVTPYGGHFEIRYLGWGIPVAALSLIALAIAGARARRAGRRFEASLAWTALAASVIAFASVTRIRGDILDHEIFWIVPLGALNLAIAVAAALREIAARWPPRPILSRLASSSATVICALLILASIRIGFRDFDRLVVYEASFRRKNADINTTFESIRGHLASQDIRKPLFRIDEVWDVAAAVLMRLHQSGQAFAVEDRWVPMFTDAFSAHGDEDAIITIDAGHRPLPDPPGDLVQRDPVRVDAVRIHR
jgi:hypothetical protein